MAYNIRFSLKKYQIYNNFEIQRFFYGGITSIFVYSYYGSRHSGTYFPYCGKYIFWRVAKNRKNKPFI